MTVPRETSVHRYEKNGTRPEKSAASSFRDGALNLNTWLLFIQYGCSFGVEQLHTSSENSDYLPSLLLQLLPFLDG